MTTEHMGIETDTVQAETVENRQNKLKMFIAAIALGAVAALTLEHAPDVVEQGRQALAYQIGSHVDSGIDHLPNN
jgi:hypothetical protein